MKNLTDNLLIQYFGYSYPKIVQLTAFYPGRFPAFRKMNIQLIKVATFLSKTVIKNLKKITSFTYPQKAVMITGYKSLPDRNCLLK